MSKRDIIAVTTLAAHLAQRTATFSTMGKPDTVMRSPACAATDAMALQRLGRSAANNATRLCNIPDYQERHDIIAGKLHAQAQAILKPYGLRCTVGGDPRGFCLFVVGLPGNTLGGDQDGYGI